MKRANVTQFKKQFHCFLGLGTTNGGMLAHSEACVLEGTWPAFTSQEECRLLVSLMQVPAALQPQCPHL